MHAYRPDHYQELGLARDADAQAIRRAYRTRAKQLHPDRSDPARARLSNEPFLRLREAYDVLRDPLRRAQYDRELARQAEMAAAARGVGRTSLVPVAATAPSRPPPPPGPGFRLFVMAISLVAVVTSCIGVWHFFLRPKPVPVFTVKAEQDDGSDRVPRLWRSGVGGPETPANPGILKREVDRVVQAQVERVEAARKRMEATEAQLSAFDSKAARPGDEAARAVPAMLVSRVECIGFGTKIVLSRDDNGTKVSYDAKPAVQARISDLGAGTVLVSRIEPANKYALGFTKGDRNDTKLLIFDSAGKVQATFNVECTAAAF
jgi:hypothetical protein